MNLHVRRGIAIFLILAFFIGAPILIIYADGYRYNFKKHQIQKTGGLIVESQPSAASVFLNEQPINKKTPLHAANLLPGQYRLEVRKDGYYPWSKKFSVQSQETIFMDKLVLFKTAEPQLVADYKIKWLEFSPQKKAALLLVSNFNQDFLYGLTLGNNPVPYLLYNDDRIFQSWQVAWSNDESKILFQVDGKSLILSTSSFYSLNDLSSLMTKNNLKNFKWLNHTAYAQTDRTLYQVDLDVNKIKPLLTLTTKNNLLDYYILNNEIYLIKKMENQRAVLTKFLPASSELQLTPNLELDASTDFFFAGEYGGYLGLWNQGQNHFYLINTNLDQIKFNKENVHQLAFDAKSEKLLLQTDQELSSLDLNENPWRENNLTRYSQGLTQAQWLTSAYYAVALQDQKIHLLETDDRDERFILTLPPEGVTTFSLDSRSQNIFYEKNQRLWQLNIK